MKGPIKSALSVALALAANQAFALGLGPIQIKSGLNQPLVAEIPIISDSAADADDLRADLASAEDFQRVGLNRSRVTVPIEFAVTKNANGQHVIRLTTKDAVREPFLDFLVAASWSKGKLLREYTILLDPPVTAPAIPATMQKPAAKSAPVETATRAPVERPRETATAPAPSSAPAPRPASSPAAAPAASAGGEYTVQRGDTLSQIANEHIDDTHDYNRMLLALYKANPSAFANANMNSLKTGAVLRIPSASEMRAVGSQREAAAEVQAQYQAWRASGQATLVGNAGATDASGSAAQSAGSGAKASEHLALVPPSASGSDNGESRGGSGGGKDSSSLRADLAHTKEALSNREQEATELKSRVSQLEDINNKSQRLISLKDSEIAELQNKLKQLGAAGTATKPGQAAPSSASAPAPAAASPSSVPAAAAPATASSQPLPATSAAPAPASTTGASAPASAPAAAPSPAASTAAAPAPQASSPAVAPGSSPSTAPKPPAPTVKPQPATAKPASATAAKPANSSGDNQYWLYGAGGILVLVGGWLIARKGGKKANPRPQLAAAPEEIDEASHAAASEADAEDSHGGVEDFDHLHHDSAVGDDMEQLRQHFDRGDADGFLTLAHTLQQKVPEDSVEWLEVTELGQQLLPENPLFAQPAHLAQDSHEVGDHVSEFGFEQEAVAQTQAHVHDDHVQRLVDLDEPLAFEPHGEHTVEAHESDDIDFEHELEKHIHAQQHESEPAHEANDAGHGLSFIDEDTIGTRLDLARAYLDMGDPEGARSMLDEVLAEGNEAQKEEARKLIAEIG
jgi:pilus assembly protein FimV